MAFAFELDRDGGAEVLKELSAAAIADLANRVAAAAGDDAIVELRTTDRAKAFVRVPKVAQATDGVLSRAAAEVGLEVRPAKERPPRERAPRAKRGRPRKPKSGN